MSENTDLKKQIERYYEEVIAPYQKTTAEAMADARKMGLLRKRDFSGHILHFEEHLRTAEGLGMQDIVIAGGDTAAEKLARQYERSRTSFLLLCEENIRFYTIAEKKQYCGSGVTVKQYTAQFQRMQEMLDRAVHELDQLDQAYQEYLAGTHPQ